MELDESDGEVFCLDEAQKEQDGSCARRLRAQRTADWLGRAGMSLEKEGGVMLTGGKGAHYKVQEKQRMEAGLRPSCRDAAAGAGRQGSGRCGGAGGSR